MTTLAETAKHTVEISRKHIVSQCHRIERQRELIERLERHGHIEFVAEAVRHLGKMKETLNQIEADDASA